MTARRVCKSRDINVSSSFAGAASDERELQEPTRLWFLGKAAHEEEIAFAS